MASNGLLAVNEALEDVQRAKAATVRLFQEAGTEYAEWLPVYSGLANTARSMDGHAGEAVAEAKTVSKAAAEDPFEEPLEPDGGDPVTKWRETAESALVAAVAAQEAGKAAAEWCEQHVDQLDASRTAVEGYITWLDGIAEPLDTIGSQCRKAMKADTLDEVERVRTQAVKVIAKATGSLEKLEDDFVRHEEAHAENAPVATKYADIPRSLTAIVTALDVAAQKAKQARPDPDEDRGGYGHVIGEFDQQW